MPCKHYPPGQSLLMNANCHLCDQEERREAQRRQAQRPYEDYVGRMFDAENNIVALNKQIAALQNEVAMLKLANAAEKPAQQALTPLGKTLTDRALEADVQAARGVKSGSAYKSDAERILEFRKFVLDILSPEMYGHAVSREVRNAARRLLGIDFKE